MLSNFVFECWFGCLVALRGDCGSWGVTAYEAIDPSLENSTTENVVKVNASTSCEDLLYIPVARTTQNPLVFFLFLILLV